MTDNVLTRDELHAAYRAGGPEGLTHYERLALVEAAVLAKCVHIKSVYGEGYITGYVPEAECRERERKAWGSGANWGRAYARTNSTHPRAAVLDAYYPSLTPPEPLVLSTGTWTYQRSDMRWQLSGEDRYFCATPTCKTAADADALAAWLRKYGTEGR